MASIHPGEVIAEELHARGMSQIEFARRLGVTPKYVCNVLAGRARITVRMALKIERVLGASAEMWISLQSVYDLGQARCLKS